MIKIPNIGGLLSVGRNIVMANRPEILFGASVVGTVAAVVAAAKGGYEARGILDDAKADRPDEPLTFKEKAKLTWICYLPAAAGTVGALSATTGLHLVHVQEKKMLAAACLMAIDEVKQQAGDYEKSLKSLGFTMSDEPEELDKVADSDGVAKLVYGDGVVEERYLVRDNKTGRDIWSNKQIIESALNEVNALLATEGNCSLDTFYSYAGFNNIPEGLEMGWSGKPNVAVSWDTTIRDDGRPVRGFTFRPAPKAGYMEPRGTTRD